MPSYSCAPSRGFLQRAMRVPESPRIGLDGYVRVRLGATWCGCDCLSVHAAWQSLSRPAPAHIGFKWLKPAKNKFTQGDLTRFSMQVFTSSVSGCLLHIQNLSNRCRHKYDLSISRIFKILFLADFCNLAQLWAPLPCLVW